MMKMNACAVNRGLKSREYTEAEWDMLWTSFNGYNGGKGAPEDFYEGVTKEDVVESTDPGGLRAVWNPPILGRT